MFDRPLAAAAVKNNRDSGAGAATGAWDSRVWPPLPDIKRAVAPALGALALDAREPGQRERFGLCPGSEADGSRAARVSAW
jgi:hypothetical protein